MNKRRDWVIQKLAAIIVWCEDLKYAIQARRFARAVALAKATPSATKIVQTKIVDKEGYVLGTVREIGPVTEMNPGGGYRITDGPMTRLP